MQPNINRHSKQPSAPVLAWCTQRILVGMIPRLLVKHHHGPAGVDGVGRSTDSTRALGSEHRAAARLR